MKIQKEFELPFKGCEKCKNIVPIYATVKTNEKPQREFNAWTCDRADVCAWGARMAKAEGV